MPSDRLFTLNYFKYYNNIFIWTLVLRTVHVHRDFFLLLNDLKTSKDLTIQNIYAGIRLLFILHEKLYAYSRWYALSYPLHQIFIFLSYMFTFCTLHLNKFRTYCKRGYLEGFNAKYALAYCLILMLFVSHPLLLLTFFLWAWRYLPN